MSNLLQIVAISPDLLIILVIDLFIAIALLSAMRYTAGLLAGVNTTEELAHKDNFAFGISLAGAVAALGIVLTGAITGEAADAFWLEAVGMTSYGLLGLVLIKAGRYTQDNWGLPHLSKKDEISKGNLAVAIVDVGNMVATAVIIRATLLWVYGLNLYTLLAVLAGFVVSQLVLIAVGRLRQYLYAKRNQGASLQQALKDGQMAVALRYSGHLIGAALAVQAANHYLIYEPHTVLANAFGWLFLAIVLTVLLSLLSGLAKKIILANINLSEEIDQQHNIGVASLEMAITIAVGLLLVGLMA